MLEICNLSFAFQKRSLFSDVNFRVEKGGLTRIAGANGSGKSTLLSLIMGLISGAAGEIKFDEDLDFRLYTSWIAPDANGLTPSLSARDNLEFWLRLRGISNEKKAIQESLDQWGLFGEWVQTSLPVSKFSTGMKRRLALARLILEESKLWILDEPLFGLDDGACKAFKEYLTHHLSRGGSAVVVTHDDRLVEGLQYQTVYLGRTVI